MDLLEKFAPPQKKKHDINQSSLLIRGIAFFISGKGRGKKKKNPGINPG
jgi:hypothetical protein